MKDFTLSCYNNTMWINSILSLALRNGKFYLNTGQKRICEVRFVTVFGTVVEIQNIKSFLLLVVDDGTGAIGCRYSSPEIVQQLQDWTWKTPQKLEATVIAEKTRNSISLCDTIFNDKTLQKDDLKVEEDSQTKSLDSLRWTVAKTFLATENFSIGDIVCVHGKLYSYMDSQQIYINAIRKIEMEEELTLSVFKLGLTKEKQEFQYAAESIETTAEIQQHEEKNMEENVSENTPLTTKPTLSSESLNTRRQSGLMTFDTLEKTRRLSIPPISSPAVLKYAHDVYAVPPANVIYGNATYDTFILEEESISDEDAFIPSTPQN